MKKIIYISLGLVFLMFVSCKEQNSPASTPIMNDSIMMNGDSTTMHNNSRLMHTDSMAIHHDLEMMDNAQMYACPMHPEVHGEKGAKCSACGMALELTETTTSEKQE